MQLGSLVTLLALSAVMSAADLHMASAVFTAGYIMVGARGVMRMSLGPTSS